MQPLVLKTRSGETTTNISRVFDISSVVRTQGTILDEEFQKNGANLVLPHEVTGLFDKISSIFIPPCPVHQDDGMIVLDDIAVRVNNLLRVIALVEKGEKEVSALEKSVHNLQQAVIGKLSGKPGIICRDLLGRRAARTCRAVLLPSYSHDPKIVYIPSHLMAVMEIKDRDIVIVGRDPTIWHGSIEVLVAMSTDGYAIRIHPFVFSQFGADCDGDCVWAMAVPEELQASLTSQICSFASSHVRTISRSASGDTPYAVNWDNPQDASKELWRSTGFSVSPEDILYDTEDLRRFKEASGKNIGQEARKIAEGNNPKMVVDYLLAVNITMLIQKVYLGPVGAAAQKLKLISSIDERLRESANYLSERTQQRLFDVKGSVQDDQRDLDDFFEILHIVNMTGKYSSSTDESILERLEELGLDKEKSRSMIVYLYSVFPLASALITLTKELGLDKEVRRSICIDVPMKLLDGEGKVQILQEIHDRTGIVPGIVARLCNEVKSDIVLGSVLNDPFYNIMNPFSKTKLKNALRLLKKRMEHGVGVSTKLTDTILRISLNKEPEVDPTKNPHAETSSVGLSDQRENRGRREGTVHLPSLDERRHDEQSGGSSQFPPRPSEVGLPAQESLAG